MPAIPPFPCFDDEAEEAAAFCCSVLPGSRVLHVDRRPGAGPGQEGPVLTVRFSLDGTEFLALNGGPADDEFNEAASFVVDCATEEERDHYWAALTDGGAEIACGWLKDRDGLRWQIVPSDLASVPGDPDPERAARATAAMMTMKKLDVRALRAAADGPPPASGGT